MKKRCPVCGAIINGYVKFDSYNDRRIVWKCNSCGYNEETDRSGLTFENIANRYFNLERTYERLR